ncbi:MAG: hypothetical protein JWN84_2792 [Nocardioides sp.]|nr:hypothetical protein [Nocardioides sp.]
MSKHSESARTLDTVAVVALTGLVLLCFDLTFADRSYLFGAAAGMVTIGAIVLVVDYYDKPGGIALLCALPAYVLVGASIGVRTTIDYIRVPSVDALVGTLSATVSAGNELLTTIPPVDSVGEATLVPYLVVYLASGAALWTALRSDRPLAPLVPLLLGLVAAVLLGTQERDLLRWQAAAFAGISLWWVSRRGARRRDVVSGQRGAVGRALGASLLVGAVAIGSSVVLPHQDDDDPDRVVLRGRVGSGHDVTAVATPLSTFRTFTRQPRSTSGTNVFDRRLLRVDGLPADVPLRFTALDVYDGATWLADNRSVAGVSDDLFLRIGSEVAAPRPGRAVDVGIQVKDAYLSDWLPLPGQLTGLEFVFLDGRAQRVDVRYNPATTTAVVLGGLDVGDDMVVDAVVAPSGLRPRARAYPTDGPLEPDGAFLDESLQPWRESGLSPLDQVRSLAKYLRTNGRYSDGASEAERRYEAGHDAERLGEDFFEAARIVGNDEQYAAFLALAANRLGVPARVVVGAVPGRGGWVEGRDVHAWVELRVADGSWRTVPPDAFISRKPPRRSDVDRVLPADFLGLDDPQDPSDAEPPAEPPTADGESGGDESAGEGGGGRSPLLWFGLLSLLTWAVPLAKLLRRLRRTSTGPPGSRIVGAWREVLDLARDLGRPVPSGLGRVEQARRLGLDPEPARQVQDTLFAREHPTPERAADLVPTLREQRRALAKEAGPVRRVWALWNPASVVPRSRLRLGQRRGHQRQQRLEPLG